MYAPIDALMIDKTIPMMDKVKPAIAMPLFAEFRLRTPNTNPVIVTGNPIIGSS
jgi:hypothetical protein